MSLLHPRVSPLAFLVMATLAFGCGGSGALAPAAPRVWDGDGGGPGGGGPDGSSPGGGSPDGSSPGGHPDGGSTDGGGPGGSGDGGSPDASVIPNCMPDGQCSCPPPLVISPSGLECVEPPTPVECGAGTAMCPTDPNGQASCTDGGMCELTCTPPWIVAPGGESCVSPNTAEGCGQLATPCPTDPHGAAGCYNGTCYIQCQPPYMNNGNSCVDDVVTCGPTTQTCPNDPSDNGFPTCDPNMQICTFNCEPPDVVSSDNTECVVPDLSPNGQTAWAAFDQDDPTALAYSNGILFWVDTEAGAVVSESLGGGAPDTLESSEDNPTLIAASAARVVWYDSGSGVFNSIALPGTTSLPVASASGVLAMTIDADALYWTTSSGTVVRQLFSGGSPFTIATGVSNPNSIAVHGSDVYWTNNVAPGPGSVQLGTITGAVPFTVAPDQSSPGFLRADAQNLYWSNAGTTSASDSITTNTGSIMQLPFGGAPMVLASGQNSPGPIAVGSSSVVWCSAGIYPVTCRLMSAPIGGGMLSTLETNASTPTDIVFAGSSICYSVSFSASVTSTTFSGEVIEFTPN